MQDVWVRFGQATNEQCNTSTSSSALQIGAPLQKPNGEPNLPATYATVSFMPLGKVVVCVSSVGRPTPALLLRAFDVAV